MKRKAEGEAEFKKLSRGNVARQSQAIVDVARDISGKIPGLTKDFFDIVLMFQYFDSMSEIGEKSKSSVLLIPYGPGAMQEVMAKMHDGLLEASTSTQT
ncbi:hypothetical protein NL676_036611 [Syzygium grande]|nr:hypothetical protein NL676_036611 [Syzygium grande]